LTKAVKRLARGAVATKYGNARHTVRYRLANDALRRAILTCARDGNLELTPRLEFFKHT
jgi:hypothetical protein